MSHFLQSKAWGEFQQSLGRKVIAESGDGWAYQAYLETGTGNRRLYCPYPTFDNNEKLDELLASLRDQAKRLNCTFLRFEFGTEPSTSFLNSHKFRKVTYQQLQPSHTQIIHLSSSKEDILAQMSQNSRNITRNYHKKEITIHTSHDVKDISILTNLLGSVARRNQITIHPTDYYRKQAEALFPSQAATLYYAQLGDTPIAAALIVDSDSTRYYTHAAADDTYRKLSAGTALVGQMILDAKDKGLTEFDLYGIAPTDSPTHPWAGFTKFKQSFGGESVTFQGTWDLPLKSLEYLVYRLYQFVARRLR
jgi:lipid II:glycine glycyltransferase (peptidoglycan interpeptide bridge formation enzyme)